jgi:hypothetical protein
MIPLLGCSEASSDEKVALFSLMIMTACNPTISKERFASLGTNQGQPA